MYTIFLKPFNRADSGFSPNVGNGFSARSPSDIADENALFVYRIYRSIQGESSYAGLPCTFVRLTGCNLRCRWCDTPEAFANGVPMSVEQVLSAVEQLATSLVEITGGEPLLQAAARPVMRSLCESGKTVLLETSGERDISGVDPRVRRIMDLKPPSSGESHRMRWQNVELLTPNDEVKFVLSDRGDYDWAREVIESRSLASRVHEVLLSCVYGQLDPRDLVQWVLADSLPVRVQLQLHKYIWGSEAKDV